MACWELTFGLIKVERNTAVRKEKQDGAKQSEADPVTYCNLINSCLNAFDDIWSPRQALIVHSVRHKVNSAFNNYLC